MRVGIKKLIILIAVISLITPCCAESLFQAGVSQEIVVTPRSLFNSVKASRIGDIVTVLIDEEIKVTDDVALDTDKTSSVTDGFSTLINKIFKGSPVPSELNGYGGTTNSSNGASATRTTTIEDTITAQVVQVLPNGNVVIQGKRATLNAGERVDVILSGIIDPRQINSFGQINSSQVANLQIAITGKGSISGAAQEGVVNKYVKYLF